MKTFWTHPANLEAVRKALQAERAKDAYPQDSLFGFMLDVQVCTNPHMARTKPSGRIIAPDGSVSPRAGWTYRWDRFTTLEESDLPWLLGLGVVQEEQEMLFYAIEGSLFRISMDFGPTIKMPRYSLLTCTV